jgi:O-methyltransferase involved in polyketide biosynthesis
LRLARIRLLGAALLLAAGTAQAVPPGKPSFTADAVCSYRAISAQHPDPKLRNPDYLAEKLCTRSLILPDDYAGARAMIESNSLRYAAFYMVNVRTHYIDAALGAVPDYVKYAPIDFRTQKLEDVLPPLGYDPAQKTFFILEGVTMYVPEAGNGATLDFIRKHSARGSRLVCDYLLRAVIEGRFKGLWAADSISFSLSQLGEPYVTGWTPREAAAFMKKHGLAVVEDVGDKELGRRHNIGSDGKPDGRLLNWHRMLEARVP